MGKVNDTGVLFPEGLGKVNDTGVLLPEGWGKVDDTGVLFPEGWGKDNDIVVLVPEWSGKGKDYDPLAEGGNREVVGVEFYQKKSCFCISYIKPTISPAYQR